MAVCGATAHHAFQIRDRPTAVCLITSQPPSTLHAGLREVAGVPGRLNSHHDDMSGQPREYRHHLPPQGHVFCGRRASHALPLGRWAATTSEFDSWPVQALGMIGSHSGLDCLHGHKTRTPSAAFRQCDECHILCMSIEPLMVVVVVDRWSLLQDISVAASVNGPPCRMRHKSFLQSGTLEKTTVIGCRVPQRFVASMTATSGGEDAPLLFSFRYRAHMTGGTKPYT